MILLGAHLCVIKTAVSRTSATRYSRSSKECNDTHVLPKFIVSHNATPFTAAKFENFFKLRGIRYLRTSPFHSASDGLAEALSAASNNATEALSAALFDAE